MLIRFFSSHLVEDISYFEYVAPPFVISWDHWISGSLVGGKVEGSLIWWVLIPKDKWQGCSLLIRMKELSDHDPLDPLIL